MKGWTTGCISDDEAMVKDKEPELDDYDYNPRPSTSSSSQIRRKLINTALKPKIWVSLQAMAAIVASVLHDVVLVTE
ncbi:hypothetical protein QYM36_009042 [Artemia franciscana]|uniref:Uncharacterized protein n=1 Tax=Artemia franciscana TaxID=6661 RepID=A0AA88HV40_ARTSF|nr:hypothetical protein QYM36_009042 [Artemia franciscana]